MIREEDLNIIVKMKFGAHLYGTATSASDLDYKGVFLPSKQDVLLGRIGKSCSYTTGQDSTRNKPGDVDYEYYSLHYFIKLACEGQTVAMDMLHAPDNMIMKKSAVWDAIVANRERFYTRNLKAFIEYARRQAGKYGIRGSRLNAVARVLEVLKAEASEKKLRDIWEALPRTDHCFDMGPDPKGMRQYQVCGKTFQESVRIAYVIPILQKFYDEYGQRAVQAAENRNIDWKAVSHAIRAAYQTKEILTRGSITFPLANAAFLKRVKQGELDYRTEAAPALEALMEEVEALVRTSSLPEKADTDYWDRFICDTLEREYPGLSSG